MIKQFYVKKGTEEHYNFAHAVADRFKRNGVPVVRNFDHSLPYDMVAFMQNKVWFVLAVEKDISLTKKNELVRASSVVDNSRWLIVHRNESMEEGSVNEALEDMAS